MGPIFEHVHDIENRLAQRDFALAGWLPLGSWTLSIQADRSYYVDTLLHHFKQRLHTDSAPGNVGACLCLVAADDERVGFKEAAARLANQQAPWEYGEDGTATLFSGWFSVTALTRRDPPLIVVRIREPQYSREAFHGHLFEIMHKILFLFDRLYVHAGAVAWRQRAHLFVGDRGGGKSTVCMRLAQEGALILSDDHVVLKQDGDSFLVSGCEETGRVTEKTEQELFRRTLPGAVRDYNGMPKKEIRMAEYFECAHHRDFEPAKIFFTRVGDAFHVAPMPRSAAVVNLIDTTRPFFRVGANAESEAYLGFCTALAQRVQAFDLTLSPELDDLARLVPMLDEGWA